MIHWLEQHLFTCFFKYYVGLECPGCGMQRALISLLKGNLAESVHYHAGLIPFLVTLLLLMSQLVLKRDQGARYVMWSFIVTTVITVAQFITKQVILLG